MGRLHTTTCRGICSQRSSCPYIAWLSISWRCPRRKPDAPAWLRRRKASDPTLNHGQEKYFHIGEKTLDGTGIINIYFSHRIKQHRPDAAVKRMAAPEQNAPEGSIGEGTMPSLSCNQTDATKGQSVESPRADKATRQPRARSLQCRELPRCGLSGVIRGGIPASAAPDESTRGPHERH